MSPYEGITYPSIFYRWPFRWLWKKYMCPQNKHLLDEVWSDSDWYLSCDVCNLEIHINKINKEYCDEPTNFLQNPNRHRSGCRGPGCGSGEGAKGVVRGNRAKHIIYGDPGIAKTYMNIDQDLVNQIYHKAINDILEDLENCEV